MFALWWGLLCWQRVTCKKANLTIAVSRKIHSLAFTEGSSMGIFFALSIPIDVLDKTVSMSLFMEANYQLPALNRSTNMQDARLEKRDLDRRSLYSVIERKLESNGYPGRACLLRTICESVKFPFVENGLVGDIIRIAFTPSSSRGEELDSDIEGAEYLSDCSTLKADCPINLLDMISQSFD